MRTVLDIETDLKWTDIKVVGIYAEQGESIAVYSAEELEATLSRLGTTSLIMHNGVAFDLPRLYEIWGWKPRGLKALRQKSPLTSARSETSRLLTATCISQESSTTLPSAKTGSW